MKELQFLFMEDVKQTSQFSFINWETLTRLVENPPKIAATSPQAAKKLSYAITASDCPNKRLEAVIEHDRFTLLRLDLDDTTHTIESIGKVLQALGISSYLIHTTASHNPDSGLSRFRVYIELAHSVTLSEWRIVQTYLAVSLGGDDCSTRPQQVMYLPVLWAGGWYRSFIAEGNPLKLYRSKLFTEAVQFDVNQKKEAQRIEQEKANQIKPQHQEQLVNGQVSIIDAVNEGYQWEALLSDYGYKRQGRAWLPPESTSKAAGVYLLTGHDGKERYYSHHSSDPCAVGKCIDKFDLLTIRSFGGSVYDALRGLAKHFPDHDAHNKRQYAIYQQALELKALKESFNG
ncbi:hypothetical protein I6Y99_004196 [Vibrio parahaemolyticus]|nr:hypothetical protein [Vibrio parahaemolyticus]